MTLIKNLRPCTIDRNLFFEVRLSTIHVGDSETDGTEHKDITGKDCKAISGDHNLSSITTLSACFTVNYTFFLHDPSALT